MRYPPTDIVPTMSKSLSKNTLSILVCNSLV